MAPAPGRPPTRSTPQSGIDFHKGHFTPLQDSTGKFIFFLGVFWEMKQLA
jgi:hypothetical protein